MSKGDEGVDFNVETAAHIRGILLEDYPEEFHDGSPTLEKRNENYSRLLNMKKPELSQYREELKKKYP